MRLDINSRREAIYLALAAAEACWLAPAVLTIFHRSRPHPPLLLWLALMTVLLAFFYVYRAIDASRLLLWQQQILLGAALVLAILFFLRFHVYPARGFEGVPWLVGMFHVFARSSTELPGAWLTSLTLLYLWARGIHLARRTLSVESVGFSFRARIVLLFGVALGAQLLAKQDVSLFIAPYFFFALMAVALARVEAISTMPGSQSISFGGFWIGSTLLAVVLLIFLGTGTALFFSGGGLAWVLSWFSPLLIVLQVLAVGLAWLFYQAFRLIIDALAIDLGAISARLAEAMDNLVLLPPDLAAEPTRGLQISPALMTWLRIAGCVGVPLVLIAAALLLTWYRTERRRVGGGDEMRESTFSPGMLAQGLLNLWQAGKDRVSDLAGLVQRFGLGPRFLSAISIRRIYANLGRLATDRGYPRPPAQTPYEYLAALHKALPGSENEVALITNAYVNAHYGEVPDSRPELQRILDAWQQVQARASQSKSAEPQEPDRNL